MHESMFSGRPIEKGMELFAKSNRLKRASLGFFRSFNPVRAFASADHNQLPGLKNNPPSSIDAAIVFPSIVSLVSFRAVRNANVKVPSLYETENTACFNLKLIIDLRTLSR
ncbi:hypothetical protein GcM1_180009 [Golovinomyces cichoracearum]|uniref:Uncharacterized protein n=1 Tax=Golovinomyces cichoracearum TaxID=62708 RepID=A0A420J495_9PEZI|nr:hypothetical protein GcM1_180009 [Golovinomyces cichoracearum]